tara:strand:+ start:11549 stop:12385 length:837 start_codon:yes stop_codon:yes gene_type:complete
MFKKNTNNTWLLNLNQYRTNPLPRHLTRKKGWLWEGEYYSDDGEDGILEYLFEYIDDINKFGVDIGSAHGYGGSNMRFLADKNDWDTTEFDFSKKWKRIHPRVKRVQVTHRNICELLEENDTPKVIDLLSLDIDSMDWYVLKSLLEGGYKSSVIILEYNPIFNYDEDYVRTLNLDYKKDRTSAYGASLSAFQKLLNKHDYTLVTNCVDLNNKIYSNNAIFLNNKFINKNDEVETIEKLHPTSWREPWKKRNKTNDLVQLKQYFKEKEIMKELEENDYV